MSDEPKELNKDNSDMFKLLADISKQNSDTLKLNTESITKLTEGQETIVKSLGDITKNISETIATTLKENVHQSDNNNPVEEGLGMEQKPKVESPTDVGDKTKAPNAYAPGEYGSTGRGGNEPAKDKGGLKMENKDMQEGYSESKPKGEMKTDPKEEEKVYDNGNKDEKKTHNNDKPKEEEKTDEPEKENKYKSFNYDNNTTIRPQVMTKSYESYPDGYQIIKAAVEKGWGVEGIDGDNAYTETIKRLNNYEFGTFGHEGPGGSYY